MKTVSMIIFIILMTILTHLLVKFFNFIFKANLTYEEALTYVALGVATSAAFN